MTPEMRQFWPLVQSYLHGLVTASAGQTPRKKGGGKKMGPAGVGMMPGIGKKTLQAAGSAGGWVGEEAAPEEEAAPPAEEEAASPAAEDAPAEAAKPPFVPKGREASEWDQEMYE